MSQTQEPAFRRIRVQIIDFIHFASFSKSIKLPIVKLRITTAVQRTERKRRSSLVVGLDDEHAKDECLTLEGHQDKPLEPPTLGK